MAESKLPRIIIPPNEDGAGVISELEEHLKEYEERFGQHKFYTEPLSDMDTLILEMMKQGQRTDAGRLAKMVYGIAKYADPLYKINIVEAVLQRHASGVSETNTTQVAEKIFNKYNYINGRAFKNAANVIHGYVEGGKLLMTIDLTKTGSYQILPS